jgi:hypothetical protein
MSYTKAQLFNDINDLVERYITEQLLLKSASTGEDDPSEVKVEQDNDGDYIDPKTGDIWDLENQCIIGSKNLQTGEKTFGAN